MPSSGKYSFGTKNNKRFMELDLPTVDEETGKHHTVLVRRPDPMMMVNAGLLDEFDSLTSLVGLHIEEVEGKTSQQAQQDQLKAFASNISAIRDGVRLMDQLVCAVVVEPEVRRPYLIETDSDGKLKRDPNGNYVYATNPIGGEIALLDAERNPDIVYTDEIPDINKTFIMNYAVGGTQDLEAFRKELDRTVATMADGEGVPMSSI
jgi:hypothetical protein